MSLVLYYWADNPQGFIWEEVSDEDIPYFLNRGWSRAWKNLSKPAETPITEDDSVAEELQPKKRGRPPNKK